MHLRRPNGLFTPTSDVKGKDCRDGGEGRGLGASLADWWTGGSECCVTNRWGAVKDVLAAPTAGQKQGSAAVFDHGGAKERAWDDEQQGLPPRPPTSPDTSSQRPLHTHTCTLNPLWIIYPVQYCKTAVHCICFMHWPLYIHIFYTYRSLYFSLLLLFSYILLCWVGS